MSGGGFTKEWRVVGTPGNVPRASTADGVGLVRVLKIRKGLDVPISGEPRQAIEAGRAIQRVALVGDDYVGMRPTMTVSVGDAVRTGDLLFTDKKTEGVRYTSPATGKIVAINRGPKRKFESLVIELAGDESFVEFPALGKGDPATMPVETIRASLVESGLWTAFRTRPYSKVPSPASTPRSIFVTAIDTSPLAADPTAVIGPRQSAFVTGLRLVSRLCDGTTYLCTAAGADVPSGGAPRVETVQFEGPHPAGLAGTHIHMLDPVGPSKTVWTIGYQDVIAIGDLFHTGTLRADRVIALSGPAVRDPRLVRTRLGASLDDVTQDELSMVHVRRISGGVLGGRAGSEDVAFLGRYHTQVAVLEEGDRREFLGWLKPGFDKFSIRRAFTSAFRGKKTRYPMTTSTYGSPRAMVPIGMYEDVMPLDIIPTFLLRSLSTRNTDQAVALGCLELDEEDLALCTFVCPGKTEYGPLLRDNLSIIEKEG